MFRSVFIPHKYTLFLLNFSETKKDSFFSGGSKKLKLYRLKKGKAEDKKKSYVFF